MEKITLSGVPETMLQTVYARAKETKRPNGVIRDDKAVDLIKKINYDFSLADKDKTMSSGVIARTIVLDRLAGDFLKKNPNALVVNIACGVLTHAVTDLITANSDGIILTCPKPLPSVKSFSRKRDAFRRSLCPLWTTGARSLKTTVNVPC